MATMATPYFGPGGQAMTLGKDEDKWSDLVAEAAHIDSFKGKGSATMPDYMDANGTPQPVTSYAGKAATAGTADTSKTCSGNSATATKATQDSAGQQINTTYIKGLSVSGKTVTYTKGDGTTGTITTQDTVYTHPTTSGNKHIPSGGSSGQILRWSADGTAVWGADNNTTYSTATQNANGLMSASDKKKLDGIATSANNYSHPNSGVTAGTYRSVTVNAQGHVTGGSNPTTLSGYGITDAPTKTGSGASGTWGINISGKANTAGTADTATKATQDSAGQQINTTYIKGLSISNNALIYTKGNGTTGNVDLIPAGTIQMFAGNTIPAGWLLCDGSAVSRTDYTKLFSAIGTTWGAGDGSRTFNLPNSIGRFAEGAATSGSYKSAGLPNITGFASCTGDVMVFDRSNGALNATSRPTADVLGKNGYTTNYDANSAGNDINFNASWSNSIYGKSTTVQPPSFTTRFIIKY